MIWPGSQTFTGAASTGKVVPIDLSATSKATIVWDLDDKSTRSALTIALEYSPDLNVSTNLGFYYLPRNQRSLGDEVSEVVIRFGTGMRVLRFPRAPLGPHRLVFVIDRTATMPLRVWQDGVPLVVENASGGSAAPDGSNFTGATGLYYMARNTSANIVTGRASVPKVYPYAFTDAAAAEASNPPEYVGPAVIDTTTQGNWRGGYGKAGVRLFAWSAGVDQSPYLDVPTLTTSGSVGRHTWAEDQADIRSPQHGATRPRGLVLNPSAQEDLTGIRVGPAYNANHLSIARVTGLRGVPTGGETAVQGTITTAVADAGWGNFISYTARAMKAGERGVIRGFARGISGAYTSITPAIANDPGTEVVTNTSAFFLGPEWRMLEFPFTAARDLVQGAHFLRYSVNNSQQPQVFQVAGLEVVAESSFPRNAGTIYTNPNPGPFNLHWTAPSDFEGWIRVYLYDYDRIGRQSSVQITVGDVTRPATTVSSYGDGKWVSWPIRVPAGAVVTVACTNVGASGNSTISALALDREAIL